MMGRYTRYLLLIYSFELSGTEKAQGIMTKKKSKEELVFLPLGGVGDIGMNFALYGYGLKNDRRWIVVDVGVTFPGDDLPGADLILPDINFITEQADRLDGIIITHAHEDHYGALQALWPQLQAPVYCSQFTAGMLEAKMASGGRSKKFPLTLFEVGEPFQVGPFEIEAVHVTHSIPEPVSLMIRSPLGNVVHTGDWKLDHEPTLGKPTDEEHFRRLGDEGVLALVCDSTNALREGDSPSEEDVSESLAQIITEAKGRVLVTTFSSNVGRIRSIALAAEQAGRKVMVFGRSMLRVCEVARDLGYLDGIAPFLSEDEFQSVARKELGNGRGFAERLKQFNLGIGQFDEHNRHPMFRQRLLGRHRGTQRILIKRRCCSQIRHGDCHMVQITDHDSQIL